MATQPRPKPETPRADGLTVNDGPTPTFEPSQMAPLAEGKPQYIQGEVTPDQPDTSETDCHGMATQPRPKPDRDSLAAALARIRINGTRRAIQAAQRRMNAATAAALRVDA